MNGGSKVGRNRKENFALEFVFAVVSAPATIFRCYRYWSSKVKPLRHPIIFLGRVNLLTAK
jgi:hypothetical protein